MSSKSSCRDIHKAVYTHVERPPQRVRVFTTGFQGVTSNLRSKGGVEIVAIFWKNRKDIPGKGNDMCKHVEERACMSVGIEVA